jgi:hypothetical protein
MKWLLQLYSCPANNYLTSISPFLTMKAVSHVISINQCYYVVISTHKLVNHYHVLKNHRQIINCFNFFRQTISNDPISLFFNIVSEIQNVDHPISIIVIYYSWVQFVWLKGPFTAKYLKLHTTRNFSGKWMDLHV